MKYKVILCGTLVVLLGSGVVWAGKPWKEKPWTEWTEKEVKIVLNDSPWVRSWSDWRGRPVISAEDGSITRDSSLPSRIASRGAEFTSRWVSSLTLREARVRWRQLQGNIDDKEAAEILSQTPGEHIIEVMVMGLLQDRTTHLDLAVFENLTEQAKKQSAKLRFWQSKQTIHPTRVEILLPYDDMRIMVASFYFPRELAGNPVIGPGEKKVTFSWILDYNIPTISVLQTKFDLRKMTRDGKPDL